VNEVALAGDLSSALESVPAAAGVGQVLGPDGKVLLVGRAANLRQWAAKNLGRGKPSKKGGRPPLDLSPIAKALRFMATATDFEQRLVYERTMAPLVPLAKRRDLKPPVFVGLDPQERFPRASVVVGTPADSRALVGPFRDRKSAEKTLAALHKQKPLRPCDYVFEPDPALPLGLGCVFAQVKTCAAPCLARVTEDAYRALAAEAAALLVSEASAAWRPAWIAPAGVRAVVVERLAEDRVVLYPVEAGAVLEEARVEAESFEAGLGRLRFPPPPAPRDDWPWLLAWLAAPRRKGEYRVLGGAAA
jgi:hypothetical protein